jgi:hypothetical protein
MNKLIALWMGERDGDKPWNLNYDSPDHFARFTGRLFENKEMWKAFWKHLWFKEDTPQMYDYEFVAWLFSDRTRFVTLFAEFLRLPETRREFGWEECPALTAYCGEFPCKQNDCKDGKVLSAWAREVNNA